MQQLKERILREGRVLPGDIIKAVGAVLVYLPLRKALRQFSK